MYQWKISGLSFSQQINTHDLPSAGHFSNQTEYNERKKKQNTIFCHDVHLWYTLFYKQIILFKLRNKYEYKNNNFKITNLMNSSK